MHSAEFYELWTCTFIILSPHMDLYFQARKLEAQLDEKMNSFRKLVSAKASLKSDASENDVESDINRLLKHLEQVNTQMQAWVSSGGTEMVSHTLTRHQEILQDIRQVSATQ